jgi:hypothetical protein
MRLLVGSSYADSRAWRRERTFGENVSPLGLCLCCVALLLAGSPREVAGQASWDSYRVPAVRTEGGPSIDGSLEDGAWQTASVIRDLIQQEPAEGEPASERTEIRLLYDENNLYLGVHAFDSDQAGIIATEMRRDGARILDEDNFQIILDTFMDARSAYMFVVSPLGAKLDQQVAEEGEGGRGGNSSNINREWDGVWDVATQRTADGWIAEVRIPWVTLRFPDTDAQRWGINFMRNIGRKNEQAFWAPIPKGFSLTRVSLAGSVTDLHSLSRGRDLRIKPFVVGGGRRVSDAGNTDNSTEQDVGLDVKMGLPAGFSLDVTINTDFAQAEVDDEQVNLTRFALFLPEKREFFLENAGQFNVGMAGASVRLADLFFSRRIGLSETGEPIPILGGARLTGKVGRNTFAMMDIQTDDAFERPGENFLIARYSRDIFARSRIGAIFVNKQASEGDHYNRTYGADLAFAPHPNLTINGFVAGTSTPEVSDEQYGGHIRANWLDQNWLIYAEHTDLQDNFNAEVGYVPRVGIRESKFHIERTPRPNRFGIRVLNPMWNIEYTTDQNGRLMTRRIHQMLGVGLQNGGGITIFYNNWFERLDEPFRVRSNVVIDPGSYHFGEWLFSYRSDPSRRISYSASYSPQTFFDGDRTNMSFRLALRVNSQLATTAQVSRNDVDLPAGAFKADVGSLRIDYALSPDASLATITQYNSLTRQWSNSGRFRYSYRPGSDIYLVYDEVRRDPIGLGEFRDRQLILKATYLLSR